MLTQQEKGGTKYCLSGLDVGQIIFITSAANQTSMFRSCDPQHGYSTNCVLLRVLQTSSVFLPETSRTFLTVLYRHFRDKNSATVAASRWFSDATNVEDTARTLVTKILDKPRYTSRRECAAHFSAY